MTIAPERLLELGHAYTAAFDARDWAAVRKMYADDAVYVSPNPPMVSTDYGNRIEGADALVAFFDQVTATNDASFEPLEHFVGHDLFTTTWRWGKIVGQDIIRYGPDELIFEQYDVTPKRTTLHR